MYQGEGSGVQESIPQTGQEKMFFSPAILVQKAQALEPAFLVVLDLLQPPDAFLEELQGRVQSLHLAYPDLERKGPG